ncbi:MAG: L-2-amino-thiazoline-4-carboxylic acid hydrolase [Eubacteriales bacterium]|nr:L-2-amino-thiazoline-4-carboxylic acid hydrolase [Eubacteriales bacterium]
MRQNVSTRVFGWLYRDAFARGMRSRGRNVIAKKQLKKEYGRVVAGAKDIGKSRMMSAYCLGAIFIAAYRLNQNAEENYEILRDGLKESLIFRKALGNADQYLSEKKMAGRREWERQSHLRKYENEWVVDVLEGNEEYDLGYDYHECGICKLCKAEGSPEIAKYLCKLDFLLADLMGMKLVRTKTLAEGADCCDFRYSRK